MYVYTNQLSTQQTIRSASILPNKRYAEDVHSFMNRWLSHVHLNMS